MTQSLHTANTQIFFYMGARALNSGLMLVQKVLYLLSYSPSLKINIFMNRAW